MSGKSRMLKNEVLRKALQGAYSAKEEGKLGGDWRAQVMGRIRRIGPLRPGPGFWPAFEHLVWRLAPATCLLVLVLAAFIVNTDFDLAYDYLDAVRGEMEKPALVEFFGLEG